MKQPKFCKDCLWSEPEENFTWNLRCTHPVVNAQDSWALASPKLTGTNAREERELRWYSFPSCGIAGKLWEKKPRLDSSVKT